MPDLILVPTPVSVLDVREHFKTVDQIQSRHLTRCAT
jgi:hypothetical protein